MSSFSPIQFNPITKILTLLAAAVLIAAPSAHASLQTVDGGLGVLDTSTNLEWTQDANLFATLSSRDPNLVGKIIESVGRVIHDTPNISNPSGAYTLTTKDFIDPRGQSDWWGAQAWVGYLNSIHYAGHSDWRLPTTSPVNGVSFNDNYSTDGGTDYGYNITSKQSELGHLYNSSLGSSGVINSGPFTNIQQSGYWSGTEYKPQPYNVWFFIFGLGDGLQSFSGQKIYLGVYSWPVRPGQDLANVPVPPAVWLFGSALLGISLLGRRKATR